MKLSDQAAALFISKTITAGLLFILGPILVRFLTQAEYGTFLQVNLLATFVVTAAPIGISQSFAYYIPKLGTGKHYQFVVRTLTLLIVFGIIGAVTIFVGRNYLGLWMNNASLAMLAPYISALIVATIISDTTETIFLAEKRGSIVAGILPIKASARLAAIMLPLLAGAGLIGVFQGLIVAMLVEAVILYGYYLYECRRHRPDAQAVELREQFSYCLPIGAALILASVGGSVDMFVVSAWFDSAHYAIYARGVFELPLTAIILTVLFDLLAPRFVEHWDAGRKDKIAGLLRESVRRIALVFYPIMCLCFVLAHQIITFLFTDNYADSVPIFRIFLLAMLFHTGYMVVVFRASGNTKETLKISILKIVLVAMFSAIFLKVLGAIEGAVIGVVVANLLTRLYIVSRASRELEISISTLIPWKDLGKTLLLSAVVAALCVPVIWWEAPKWLILLAGSSLYGLLFVVAAFYLERLTEGDKVIVQRWVSYVMPSVFMRMRREPLQAGSPSSKADL